MPVVTDGYKESFRYMDSAGNSFKRRRNILDVKLRWERLISFGRYDFFFRDAGRTRCANNVKLKKQIVPSLLKSLYVSSQI